MNLLNVLRSGKMIQLIQFLCYEYHMSLINHYDKLLNTYLIYELFHENNSMDK